PRHATCRPPSPMPALQTQPKPPFPPQHQPKPGTESELQPRPEYEAPLYKGSGKLEGKVAIVTGGDSGIGRAVAVLYAREGADVAIVFDKSTGDAEETKRAVEKEGRRCLLIQGDVSQSAFCREAVGRTVRELGRLAVLVNCVAPGPVWTPLNASDKPAKEVAKFGQGVPFKRPAQPEEIAPAFVFFASEADSSYITGEVLTLLGGETTAG